MNDALRQGIVIFLFIAVPGSVGGWLAACRGRNFLGWALLCGIFPVCLMVIWFKKPIREVPGRFRQCPRCREWLKWRETLCRYCGAEMPER